MINAYKYLKEGGRQMLFGFSQVEIVMLTEVQEEGRQIAQGDMRSSAPSFDHQGEVMDRGRAVCYFITVAVFQGSFQRGDTECSQRPP